MRLSIFNHSKDPEYVCACVCGFWLICSSENFGNEKDIVRDTLLEWTKELEVCGSVEGLARDSGLDS